MKKSSLFFAAFFFLFLALATVLGLTQQFIPFQSVGSELAFTVGLFTLGTLMLGAALPSSSPAVPDRAAIVQSSFANPFSDIEVQADRHEEEQRIWTESC